MKRRWFLHISLIILATVLSGCGIVYPPGGQDPIHSAILRQDVARVEALLRSGVDVNTTDGYGRTPLYLAGLVGSRPIAKLLLEHGADPLKGAKWKGQAIPIDVAAENGYTDVVELLLDWGVDVNQRTNRGRGPPPLMDAAAGVHPETVKLLLQRGADVHARDSVGGTVLHYGLAIQPFLKDYRQQLHLLLAAGADVNAKDHNGYTALTYALWLRDEDVVRLLLEAGARVELHDPQGKPLTYAQLAGGNRRIEALLREYGEE